MEAKRDGPTTERDEYIAQQNHRQATAGGRRETGHAPTKQQLATGAYRFTRRERPSRSPKQHENHQHNHHQQRRPHTTTTTVSVVEQLYRLAVGLGDGVKDSNNK